MRGHVGPFVKRLVAASMIVSGISTVVIVAMYGSYGQRVMCGLGAVAFAFVFIGWETWQIQRDWPPMVPVEDLDRAVKALEEVAHFAPGRAGVLAAQALVDLGVWVDTIELHEQPIPVTWALRRLGEVGPFKHAVHDGPMAPYMAESVVDGTWTFVVPVRLDEPRCANPFCDGAGNIDVSPKITGRSRTFGTCEVGPHR